MPANAKATARVLIASYGSRALEIAERAAANVVGVGMHQRAAQWALVIDEIKAIQKTAPLDAGWHWPYISTVSDPTAPEILAWLDTPPLRDRLATLHTMPIAFPQLRQREEWQARVALAHAELRPTAEELGDILNDASRRGEQLKPRRPDESALAGGLFYQARPWTT
jgi:hypothetical protein